MNLPELAGGCHLAAGWACGAGASEGVVGGAWAPGGGRCWDGWYELLGPGWYELLAPGWYEPLGPGS